MSHIKVAAPNLFHPTVSSVPYVTSSPTPSPRWGEGWGEGQQGACILLLLSRSLQGKRERVRGEEMLKLRLWKAKF